MNKQEIIDAFINFKKEPIPFKDSEGFGCSHTTLLPSEFSNWAVVIDKSDASYYSGVLDIILINLFDPILFTSSDYDAYIEYLTSDTCDQDEFGDPKEYCFSAVYINYEYGSCAVCDPWHPDNMPLKDRIQEVLKCCIFFDDIGQFKEWVKKKMILCGWKLEN